MALAFVLLIYSSYLATNHLKTLMAARHASWLLGTRGGQPDLDTVKENIDTSFGFDPELTQLHLESPAALFGFLTGDDAVGKEIAGAGGGPFRVQVTFGLTSEEVRNSTKFPFNLMNVTVPFMGETRMDISQVSSVCQWDEVGNTWSTLSSALSGLFDKLSGIQDKLP
ncbi:MAG: hypothetical protein HY299_14365 [Verrucomicrobia bacterium]|nr:hypothetical protein [Verrucomicrobiota bacterium]